MRRLLPYLLALSAGGCFCLPFPIGPPGFDAGLPQQIPCDFEGQCPGDMLCNAELALCEPGFSFDAGACETCSTLTCVDLLFDPQHCGTCTNACPSGQSCLNGQCVGSSGGCVFCGPSQTCVGNTCTCPSGSMSCDMFLCIDTQQSIGACGVCDVGCSAQGEGCRNGHCVCAAGWNVCTGVCHDTRYDPNNCGACGVVCDAGVCDKSQCVPSCSTNPANACHDRRCWDIANDRLHCGDACASCSTGQQCYDGGCACPPGFVELGNKCLNLALDPKNCGDAGVACPPGSACRGGTCTCSAPLQNCNGTCVDVLDDGSHCGSCGHACPAGQLCSNGACVGSCGMFTQPCDSGCPDVAHDPFNCGSCGRACPSGEICLDTSCVAMIPAHGCTACPCDDCDFEQRDLCCDTDAGPFCFNGSRCP